MNDFQVEDEIVITGCASSPIRYYKNLKATIATVSIDAIKVWADIDGETHKIWFPRNEIHDVHLLQREES